MKASWNWLPRPSSQKLQTHYAHYQHALVCMILNEAPRDRDACAAMVAKSGETDDAMAANLVA